MAPDRAIDVLVIDDDDLTAEMVRRSLREGGARFRVVAAYDGQDGLDVLRGEADRTVARPCLILLDLDMPRMNGFEFLEALRNESPRVDSVVIVLTTSNADADRSRAYQENIAGYMVKSVVGPQFSKLSTFLTQYSAMAAFP